MTGTPVPPSPGRPLLEARGLRIAFDTPDGPMEAVRGIDFALEAGGTLGLTGESGSGKSLTALALLGLLPAGARWSGSLRFDGRELAGLPEPDWCRLRGGRIAMVFQEPMTALNPLQPVGAQVAEPLRLHRSPDRRAARRAAAELLDRVGIAHAARRLDDLPHRFSGGQRQRIGIAMALAGGPRLLVADEPTTALDTVTQRQILDLLDGLVAERGLALLLVSHDLAVLARRVRQLLVMRRGEILERGPAAAVLRHPAHAYTRALLAARPRGDAPAAPESPDSPAGASGPLPASAPGAAPSAGRRAAPRPSAAPVADCEDEAPPLLEVQGLVRRYRLPRPGLWRPAPVATALDGVGFTLRAGASLGIVGASGSGKSTLARLVMALDRPAAGRVMLAGRDLHALPPAALRAARRDIQMVFQDPQGSLDPRMTVARTVAEPLAAQGAPARACRARAAELLEAVGLRPDDLDRHPHEFSGGQRQRIAIARALVTGPRLLVADEPVSALDMTVQAQILALLADLRARHGLALLLISHDLAVVRRLCDEVAVLDAGRIVERGRPADLFRAPAHPATRALVEAMPTLPDAGD